MFTIPPADFLPYVPSDEFNDNDDDFMGFDDELRDRHTPSRRSLVASWSRSQRPERAELPHDAERRAPLIEQAAADQPFDRRERALRTLASAAQTLMSPSQQNRLVVPLPHASSYGFPNLHTLWTEAREVLQVAATDSMIALREVAMQALMVLVADNTVCLAVWGSESIMASIQTAAAAGQPLTIRGYALSTLSLLAAHDDIDLFASEQLLATLIDGCLDGTEATRCEAMDAFDNALQWRAPRRAAQPVAAAASRSRRSLQWSDERVQSMLIRCTLARDGCDLASSTAAAAAAAAATAAAAAATAAVASPPDGVVHGALMVLRRLMFAPICPRSGAPDVSRPTRDMAILLRSVWGTTSADGRHSIRANLLAHAVCTEASMLPLRQRSLELLLAMVRLVAMVFDEEVAAHERLQGTATAHSAPRLQLLEMEGRHRSDPILSDRELSEALVLAVSGPAAAETSLATNCEEALDQIERLTASTETQQHVPPRHRARYLGKDYATRLAVLRRQWRGTGAHQHAVVHLKVDPTAPFESALAQIGRLPPKHLRGAPLKVTYTGEMGADQGGLRRQLFADVGRSLTSVRAVSAAGDAVATIAKLIKARDAGISGGGGGGGGGDVGDDDALETLSQIRQALADADAIERECAGGGGGGGGGSGGEDVGPAAKRRRVEPPPMFKLTQPGASGQVVPSGAETLCGRVGSADEGGAIPPVINESTLSRYRAIGRLGGLALTSGCPLGVPFARYFVRLVQREAPRTVEELQDELREADGDDWLGKPAFLHSGWVEEMGRTHEMTFSRHTSMRVAPPAPLATNPERVLTEANKADFLHRHLEHRLVRTITQQVHACAKRASQRGA